MGKVLLFKPSTYSGASYGTTLERPPTPPIYPPRPVFPPGTPARLQTTAIKQWEVKVASMKAQYEADVAAWNAAHPATPAEIVKPQLGFQSDGPAAAPPIVPELQLPPEFTDVASDLIPGSGAEVIDLFEEEPEGMLATIKPYLPYIAIGGLVAFIVFRPGRN